MEHAGLVATANENFVASYRKLVEHCARGAVRDDGGVFAFSSGVPLSFFNGCLVLSSASEADVEAALDWLEGQQVPYRAWTAPELAPELSEVFGARGLEPGKPYPGMVLHPVPQPPAPADGVEVMQVGEDGLDEFLQIGVDSGLALDLVRSIYSRGFADDAEVQLFTARVDGHAVGTSVAIQSKSASGIYAVGTLPAARRRGVGAALTWAAVAAGADRGRDAVVLQSSPMGFSLYSAMGFETVIEYAAFVVPPPEPRG